MVALALYWKVQMVHQIMKNKTLKKRKTWAKTKKVMKKTPKMIRGRWQG